MMSIKLKAIGLSLMAALAVSAFAVVNASAVTGGHFISSEAHTKLHALDENTDQTQFTGAATVECHTATYSGTSDQTTETEVTITPTYSGCTSTFGDATVNMNECDYVFTVRSSPATNHNTVHFVCPKGSAGAVITTPTCTITVTPNQTPTGGVTYTNIANGDVTVGVTVEGLHATYSPAGSFGCAFQSTTSNAKMHGSAIMAGTNNAGGNVNVSAT